MKLAPPARMAVLDVHPHRPANESRTSVFAARWGSVHPISPRTTVPQSAEGDVLNTLLAADTPLTLHQLHQETGIPASDLAEATTSLCNAKLVIRLNTIIESYVPGPGTMDEGPVAA